MIHETKNFLSGWRYPTDGTAAFLTDTQVAFDSDARAATALFDQLNQQDGLAFVYMAGDFTDSPRNEWQWELLFRGGG